MRNYQLSSQVSPYLEVGREMESHVTPQATLLGSERWWWALHDYPYLSLNNLWQQWKVANQSGPQSITFGVQVNQVQADFIITNRLNTAGDIRRYPEQLQREFADFLRDCTVLVAEWTDATYREIQIFEVIRPLPALTSCRGKR